MTFDILTIFPKAFESYFSTSLMARAQAKRFISIRTHDLRAFATDRHRSVDDRPYGGGAGMVLRADVMQRALLGLKSKVSSRKSKVILLTPQGQRFDQETTRKLGNLDRLVLIAGRYEGYDERIRSMVDMELSIGDFVLSGGELPAMIVVDAVARLVPGVLGKKASLEWESFSQTPTSPDFGRQKKTQFKGPMLLEYPQYTKPEKLKVGTRSLSVPKVLLSGDHKKIFDWRLAQARAKTIRHRPDLLKDQNG